MLSGSTKCRNVRSSRNAPAYVNLFKRPSSEKLGVSVCRKPAPEKPRARAFILTTMLCYAARLVDTYFGTRGTPISFPRALRQTPTIGVMGRGKTWKVSLVAFLLQSRVSLFPFQRYQNTNLGSHISLDGLPVTKNQVAFFSLAGMLV